ncbi:hypothetical protein PtB15_17B186 [Puccinia triticina]|nr:hypothetical protein PtB15_17B186 [Puccinia triticina]
MEIPAQRTQGAQQDQGSRLPRDGAHRRERDLNASLAVSKVVGLLRKIEPWKTVENCRKLPLINPASVVPPHTALADPRRADELGPWKQLFRIESIVQFNLSASIKM